MKFFLGTASILALSALPAMAQDAINLDTITVYANQTATETSRTGASVDVVTQSDLDTSPTTKLADYLDGLAGVTVSSNGGLGGITTVRVRGLSGQYVPVLIDGIDVTDPTGTQHTFDWSNLAMGNIARVEIVKGSQSAVHGSNAVGGVINISTTDLDVDGTKVDVSAEYGSYNTQRTNLALTSGNERGAVSFGLSRVSTDGFSAREGAGQTEDDGYEGTQLTLGAKYSLTDNVMIGFSAYAVDAEYDFDASSFDETGSATSDTRAVRAYAEFGLGGLDHTFSISRFKIDRTSTSGGFTDPFKGQRDKIDYKATANINDSTRLTFGADWTKESALITGGIYGPPTWARSGSTTTSEEVTTKGLFYELAYAPSDNLDIVVSQRFDNHSRFGTHRSDRLSVAYRPTSDLTIRGLLSSGFRAPSFYELYAPFYGNPALEEENSRNVELGVEKTYSNGAMVQATVFYNEIENLIQFAGSGYNQVPGTSKSRGLEFSASMPVNDRVSLTGSYTWSKSETSTGSAQLRIPTHDLSLGVSAQLTDKLAGGLSVQRVVDRPDEFGTVMEDYTLVNLNASYDINDTVQAYVRVENLMDTEYQTAGGYATSDRAAYFGLRASF